MNSSENKYASPEGIFNNTAIIDKSNDIHNFRLIDPDTDSFQTSNSEPQVYNLEPILMSEQEIFDLIEGKGYKPKPFGTNEIVENERKKRQDQKDAQLIEAPKRQMRSRMQIESKLSSIDPEKFMKSPIANLIIEDPDYRIVPEEDFTLSKATEREKSKFELIRPGQEQPEPPRVARIQSRQTGTVQSIPNEDAKTLPSEQIDEEEATIDSTSANPVQQSVTQISQPLIRPPQGTPEMPATLGYLKTLPKSSRPTGESILNEMREDADGVTWMPLKDGLAKMGEKIRNTAQLGVGLSALRAKELLEKLKSRGEVVDELDESIRKSKKGENSKIPIITPQEAKDISENLRDSITGSKAPVQSLDDLQILGEISNPEIMLREEDLAAVQQLIRDFNDTEKVNSNESEILRQQILKKQLFYFSQYLDQNEEWLTRLINELQPGFELNSIKEKKAFANYIDPFDDEKTVAEGFNLLGVSNILEELYTKLQQLPPEKQTQVETDFNKLYSFVSELTLVQIYFPEQINSLTWQEAIQKGVAQKTSLLMDLEKNGINVEEHDLDKPLVSQPIWSYDPALLFQPSLYGGNYNWIKNDVHLKPEAAKKYMNILKEKNDNSTENSSAILADQSQPDDKSETNLSGENVLVDQQTKIDEIKQRAEQLKAQQTETVSTISVIDKESSNFQNALMMINSQDEIQVHRLQRSLGIEYDEAKGILQTLEQDGYIESGGELQPRKVIKKLSPQSTELSNERIETEASLPISEQKISENSFKELSRYVQEMREKIRETYLKGTNEPDGILQELNKKYIELQHIMMEQWFKENMQLVEIVSKHHHNSEDFITLFRKQLLSEHRVEEAIYQIHNVQNEMRYVNKKEQVNLTKFIESFKKAIETIDGGTLIDLQEYIGKTKADINKDGVEYKEFLDVSLVDNTNRSTDQARIIGVELGFDPSNPLSQRIMPTIIFGAPSNY